MCAGGRLNAALPEVTEARKASRHWLLQTFTDWFYSRRDRLLGDPGFHRRVQRFPLTRWIARRRARTLFDVTAGFVYSQTLSACVRLRLFEMLAQGPRTTTYLAGECGLGPDAFDCLASAAAELKLLRQCRGDRWGLGELGAASRGSPGIEAMVRHHELLYRDMADPIELLRNRSHASLRDYWTYAASQGESPQDAATQYSELMARSQSFVADDVLAHSPLERSDQLLDVGGGSGFFAAEAMRRFPHLKVTVFDLPAVAALADQRFIDEGLAERGSSVGGSVFDDPLPSGYDAVSLIRVLHDHDDHAVMRILRAVRQAMRSDGRLLIAEPMAETAQARGVGAYFHLYLWAMGSGKPRSRARLQEILEASAFADVREHGTFQPLQIRLLSARPAETF